MGFKIKYSSNILKTMLLLRQFGTTAGKSFYTTCIYTFQGSEKHNIFNQKFDEEVIINPRKYKNEIVIMTHIVIIFHSQFLQMTIHL